MRWLWLPTTLLLSVSITNVACTSTMSGVHQTESSFATLGSNAMDLAATAGSAKIYVSLNGSDGGTGDVDHPLRTLEAARAMVRTVKTKTNGDIFVYLRGGVYYLDQTFCLGKDDGGQGDQTIHYASYPGERATLSGGRPISGWQSANDRGIYFADARGLNFRELYAEAIAGPQLRRARFPKTGYLTLTSYNFANGAATSLAIESNPLINGLGNEARFAGAEAVISKEHTLSRLRINYASHVTSSDLRLSLVDADARAEAQFVGSANAFMIKTPFRIHFENSLSFLSDAREWFLDPAFNRVYLIPDAGVDLSAVIAPKLETIVAVEGDFDARIGNLAFEDLDIKHAAWTYASTHAYVGGQAVRCTNADALPCEATGGVTIKNATHVAFRRNRIMRMGGHGVVVGANTDQIQISANYVAEIQGNGVMFQTFEGFRYAEASARTDLVSVDNNIIETIGLGYDGVGIFVPYATRVSIRNNQISGVANSGISFGYFFDYAKAKLAFTPNGNSIYRNDISNVMLTYQDGGGIYTLPATENLLVAENYIHDIPKSVVSPKGWAGLQPGLYLDMLTNHATFRDNYLANLFDGVFIQGEKDKEAQFNVVATNWSSNVANAYTTGGDQILADARVHQNMVETHALARPDIAAAAGPSLEVKAYWGR